MAKRGGLTDLECRSAKPRDKPYKLADERGLFLLVTPKGFKWWRLRYVWQGKDQLLSLGVYPEVPLAGRKLSASEREAGKPDRIKGARELRDEARELLAAGINPSHQKQQAREAVAAITADAFEAVAREWYGHKCAIWTATQAEKVLRRLEGELFPWIGTKPIREVTPPELLACLRRTATRGAVDTAHRTRQDASMIFRYAIASGRAERDPAADVRGALPAIRKKHYATITEPRAVGELMRAIQGASGTFPTLCALRLAPLVFVRPGELRHAEWSEFDLDAAEWRIPAEKMKMRAPHIVPLGQAADEASARARRAAANVRRAEDAGNPEATAGASGLPSIVGGARAVIGIAAGLQAINLARSAVANSADLDGLNRQLEAVFGSTVRAGREFEFARSEALRLGLELQSTARSYAQFSAATLGTRLEGEKTRDIFSAVNEAAARLGLSTDQTAGALTALQQIASKGTVQSEELRGQLGERLPGAFQIAARAMGVTTAELGKLLEQGQVVSDVFLPKFAAELRRSFNTDSETRIESLRSGFARLRSEGGLFAAEFFEPIASGASGAADLIAGLFKQLNDYTREAKNNLEDLGNGIVRARSTGALFEQRRGGLVPVGQADPRDPEAAARVTRGDIRNVIPLAPRPILPDIVGLVPKPGALPDFGPEFSAQFEVQTETKKTAELREQLALVGARTELERALYAITKGDQRSVGNTEKNLLIALAKARDAIRTEKAAASNSLKASKLHSGMRELVQCASSRRLAGRSCCAPQHGTLQRWQASTR